MEEKEIYFYSLRCDRGQIWSFNNGGLYSGYAGELLTKLPAYTFVGEYLACGRNLKYENTSYYWFISELGSMLKWDAAITEFQPATWCKNLINTIEFSKESDAVFIDIFEICDNIFMIIDGHHRACCANYFGKQIKIGNCWKTIKRVWEFDEEQMFKINEAFSQNHPHLKYYYPPFWKDKVEVKILRGSELRLNAILRDIISLKGSFISASYPGGYSSVLEIGCCTGFFSSAIDQIPAIHITAVDNDLKFINIINVRRELTGHPFRVVHGTVKDINEEFDATLFIDVFFQILMKEGLKEAQYQFERICELSKERIYFGLGMPEILNKYGTLSDFHRKILFKYGFNDIEMIYFGRNEIDQYKRAIFVAKK